LGMAKIPVPVIRPEAGQKYLAGGISVTPLGGESWDKCAISAYYFEPLEADESTPAVVICCGHGLHGKRTDSYFHLGLELARRGIRALIPDNMGQGERTPMGHKEAVKPFAGKFSFQGMIVQET